VDYVPVSETVSWADQEEGTKSVLVTVKKDRDRTPAETMVLVLGAPSGGVTLGSVSAAVFTILEKPDGSGPSVRIVAPRANTVVAWTSAATITVDAKVADLAGVRSVQALVNGAVPVEMVPAGDVYRATVSGLENGRNTIVVSATDVLGNVGSATVSVEITMTRSEIAGAYNGLVEMDADVRDALAKFSNSLVQSRDGLLRLVVTSTGRFTGTLQMAGMRQALAGVFLSTGEANFGGGTIGVNSVELFKNAGGERLSLGFLKLRWVVGTGRMVGSVEDRAAGAEAATLAELVAEPEVYTDKANPVEPLRNVPPGILGTAGLGNYTAVLGALGGNGVPVSGYPRGAGFATMKVSKAGVVELVGRLADGSAVSYSNALSSGNEWPVYVPLYGNRGYMVGTVQFDPSQVETDAAGLLDWYRPDGVTALKNYPSGWNTGIGLDLKASKYVVPVRGASTTVLGISAAGIGMNNIRIRTVGQLGTTSNEAGISVANAITVNGATAGSSGANGLSVRVDARTGLFAASSFQYGGVSCGIQGAVLQKSRNAAGYFQYAPARVNPVGTAESGLLEITRIP
jgi:hypothetical protein